MSATERPRARSRWTKRLWLAAVVTASALICWGMIAGSVTVGFTYVAGQLHWSITGATILQSLIILAVGIGLLAVALAIGDRFTRDASGPQ